MHLLAEPMAPNPKETPAAIAVVPSLCWMNAMADIWGSVFAVERPNQAPERKTLVIDDFFQQSRTPRLVMKKKKMGRVRANSISTTCSAQQSPCSGPESPTSSVPSNAAHMKTPSSPANPPLTSSRNCKTITATSANQDQTDKSAEVVDTLPQSIARVLWERPVLVARQTATRLRSTTTITILPIPITETTAAIIVSPFSFPMSSDTPLDTTSASTTTVTITIQRSKTSTSTQTSWAADDPTPAHTPLITTITKLSTIRDSAPTSTSTAPSVPPAPNSRLKTGVIIGPVCALIVIILVVLIPWYILRRRRHSEPRIRHSNTRLHKLKPPKNKKKKSSPSSPGNNTFTSKRNPNLIGLEYVVSKSSTGQSEGIIREHTRDTMPPPLPANRLNKPFIENLQLILGHGDGAGSEAGSEWASISGSESAIVPPLNVPGRNLTGMRTDYSTRTGDSRRGQRRYAADVDSGRSVWMSGTLPPDDEAVIRVQTGGDGWV